MSLGLAVKVAARKLHVVRVLKEVHFPGSLFQDKISDQGKVNLQTAFTSCTKWSMLVLLPLKNAAPLGGGAPSILKGGHAGEEGAAIGTVSLGTGGERGGEDSRGGDEVESFLARGTA